MVRNRPPPRVRFASLFHVFIAVVHVVATCRYQLSLRHVIMSVLKTPQVSIYYLYLLPRSPYARIESVNITMLVKDPLTGWWLASCIANSELSAGVFVVGDSGRTSNFLCRCLAARLQSLLHGFEATYSPALTYVSACIRSLAKFEAKDD